MIQEPSFLCLFSQLKPTLLTPRRLAYYAEAPRTARTVSGADIAPWCLGVSMHDGLIVHELPVSIAVLENKLLMGSAE